MNATLTLPMDGIRALCRQYHVKELAVFGSALDERFREDSDLDLLVEFEPGARIGLIAFIGLGQEIEQLVGRKVDLVPKDGLKPLIRDYILSQREVIYAS